MGSQAAALYSRGWERLMRGAQRARDRQTLSEPFASVTACEVLPILCPIRIPIGRLAKPFLGKIQKGPHLRWHHAMRREDPEDATRRRGNHGGPLGKHVPQATRLDILAAQ